MHEALVVSFENSDSYIDARKVSQLIIRTNNFTQEQLYRIQQSCKSNDQASGSFGVPEKIENYLNAQGFKTDDAPF